LTCDGWYFGELDDVKAEVGFDDLADFARLHREHRLLERLDHHAASEEAEVSALCEAEPGSFEVSRAIAAKSASDWPLPSRAPVRPSCRAAALSVPSVLIEMCARAPLLGRAKASLVLLVISPQLVLGHLPPRR
jgi:hypothetical protein